MNNSYILEIFILNLYRNNLSTTIPWVPEVFSRVRQGASLAAAQHVFARAGHFFRLNRNRKPRLKSLWHPGYHHPDQTEYCQISIRFRLLYCKTIGYQIRNEGYCQKPHNKNTNKNKVNKAKKLMSLSI